MKRTLLAVAFVLGTLATFGQTTQKVQFNGINVPMYFKFINDYTQVRMTVQGEESTPYLDVTNSFIQDDCLFLFIEDTNGAVLTFVRCEDGSVAMQVGEEIYEGEVTKVTSH